MGNRGSKDEVVEHELPDLSPSTYLDALRLYYKTKVLPTEIRISYDMYGTPPLLDAEFTCPPALLVLGMCSVGKTTAINHILNAEYAGSRTGPEPTTDCFFIIMYGPEHCSLPATTMINDKTFPYQGMSRLGNVFLNKCYVILCPIPLLKHLTIIDTPGILSGEKQVKSRPYDFNMAISYFAEKVDKVLFMFDAIKLDICDEVRRLLTALQQYDDKVLIMLNKADSCDALQLNKVRASLSWTLSRILKAAEAPRIYCGSLWDRPLKFLNNRELFDHDMRLLFHELRALTYTVYVRQLTQATERAEQASYSNLTHVQSARAEFQVRMFALIANEIHENFFSVCVRYGKRRVAASLDQEIYPEVIRRHKISKLDLPPVPAMQRLILGTKADPLPRVSQRAIQDLEEFIFVDVHRFLQNLPPEGSIKADYGRLNESALYSDNDELDWCATAEEAIRYGWRTEFRDLQPIDGRLGPHQVAAVMEGSGLSRPILDQIWRLVDHDTDGLINEDEFCLIKFLLKRTAKGYSVPFELTDRMRPPREHVPRRCEQLYRQMRQIEKFYTNQRPLAVPQPMHMQSRWDLTDKDANLENVSLKSKNIIDVIRRRFRTAK